MHDQHQQQQQQPKFGCSENYKQQDECKSIMANDVNTESTRTDECEAPALRALLTAHPLKKLKYEPNYSYTSLHREISHQKVPDFNANTPPLSPIDGLTINAESLLPQDWSAELGKWNISP